jgi:hypothetical protein
MYRDAEKGSKMFNSLLKRFVTSSDNQPCLYGRFSMSVYSVNDGEKKLIRRIQKKNQVVNDGREVVLQLLGQMAAPGIFPIENQIWSFEVGTGGTPPLVTDTALYATVWLEPITSLECVIVAIPPSTYELQIVKTLPTTPCTANGYTIQEAGIFTRGDNPIPGLAANRRLYCRQTYPSIVKVDTMQIVFDWRLGITVE